MYLKWCKELKISFGHPLKEEDFILISRTNGKPISPNSLNYAVNIVADNQNLKKITVYGLRHTHATILISKRIPDKVIADRLGNTPPMINYIYIHTF
ncbi:MAG: tyrosine-type recombinase/integrase [Bacillota bacterium]|uniref:tyrosine-type recombinase/integrase n=1 Tax=Bacillus pumilus TaxID=1408 RepID=UPI00345EB114